MAGATRRVLFLKPYQPVEDLPRQGRSETVPKALFIARVGAFDTARLEHEDVVSSHASPAFTCDHVNAETGMRFDILQIVDLTLHRKDAGTSTQIENMKAGLFWQVG